MNLDLLNSYLHPTAHVTLVIHERGMTPEASTPGSSRAPNLHTDSASSSRDSSPSLTARIAAVLGRSVPNPARRSALTDRAIIEPYEESISLETGRMAETDGVAAEATENADKLEVNVSNGRAEGCGRADGVRDTSGGQGLDEAPEYHGRNAEHGHGIHQGEFAQADGQPAYPASLASHTSRKREQGPWHHQKLPKQRKNIEKPVVLLKPKGPSPQDAVILTAKAALISKWEGRIKELPNWTGLENSQFIGARTGQEPYFELDSLLHRLQDVGSFQVQSDFIQNVHAWLGSEGMDQISMKTPEHLDKIDDYDPQKFQRLWKAKHIAKGTLGINVSAASPFSRTVPNASGNAIKAIF